MAEVTKISSHPDYAVKPSTCLALSVLNTQAQKMAKAIRYDVNMKTPNLDAAERFLQGPHFTVNSQGVVTDERADLWKACELKL